MSGTEAVRASYDTVAGRYADEIGGELAGKPVDRALYALFAELVRDGTGPATVGDVGCGPGHVADHLVDLGLDPVGIDLSPAMIEVARRRYRGRFAVGTLVALPVGDGRWAGAVAAYSIIHLDPAGRAAAFAELARVIRPGGYLLVGFHVSDPGQPVGSAGHLTRWWDLAVDLDFHYLDPDLVATELSRAGFSVVVRTVREPWPEVEHPSRRGYLLARRGAVRPDERGTSGSTAGERGAVRPDERGTSGSAAGERGTAGQGVPDVGGDAARPAAPNAVPTRTVVQ